MKTHYINSEEAKDFVNEYTMLYNRWLAESGINEDTFLSYANIRPFEISFENGDTEVIRIGTISEGKFIPYGKPFVNIGMERSVFLTEVCFLLLYIANKLDKAYECANCQKSDYFYKIIKNFYNINVK